MRPSGAGRSGHGSMQQKVIDVPSYQDVDKFIHRTENPYVLAIHDPNVKGTEKVLRQVREILNKLTPQKFQKLAQDLIALDINSEERLKGVIDVIFEKAIDEPAFSQTYANLCKILCPVSKRISLEFLNSYKNYFLTQIKVSKSSANGGTFAFRTLLLSRCQKEFETDFYKEINYEELLKGKNEKSIN
jgi:translation initiation factor 4G